MFLQSNVKALSLLEDDENPRIENLKYEKEQSISVMSMTGPPGIPLGCRPLSSYG
jgi:hypothetical protein